MTALTALQNIAARPARSEDSALDAFVADRLAHYARFNALSPSDIQRLVIQDVRAQF